MRHAPRWKAARWGLLGVGLMLTLAALGCGGPFTGEVTGTVQYNGQPLPGGKVTIIHPDGRIGEGDIKEDGTYSIPKAPGGDVKVTVQTIPPIAGIPGISKPLYPAGKYVPIPLKYRKTETSELKLEVKRGSQKFDIELTD
jgi:hypothetical protein